MSSFKGQVGLFRPSNFALSTQVQTIINYWNYWFHTNLLNVRQSEQSLLTTFKSNAHVQSVICRSAKFVTNAHAQDFICTQLFAVRLTYRN